MSDPNLRNPKEEWWVVVFIMLALCFPLYLVLSGVDGERPRVEVETKEPLFPSKHHPDGGIDNTTNPSPYGYTASLTIWLFPTFLILIHLFRILKQPRKQMIFRSVRYTAVLLGGLGLLLDTIFGTLFFTFPNRDAILGPCLPAVTWGLTDDFISWELIPIEEYGFYFFGSLAIILMYVWCDEYWLAAYQVKDENARRKELASRMGWSILHWKSLWIGVLIFLAGWGYREWYTDAPPGFPGYLLFLVLIGILPSMLMYHLVKRLINFRALSVTFLMTVLMSTAYEVVLGVPYQWWGFRPEQMMGVPIAGFSGVPLEEPILWVAIVWASVIFLEMIHTMQYSGLRESVKTVVKGFKKEESSKE